MSACESPLFVGSVGVELVVQFIDCDGPIKLATEGLNVLEIRIQNPAGATTSHVAAYVTDGEDGKIRYITVAGDLDVAGNWKIQGFASNAGPAKLIPSDIGKFVVEQTL